MRRGGELKRTTPLERKTALTASPLARSSLHAAQAGHQAPARRRRPRDTGPSAKVVAVVWRRDEGRCFRCGAAVAFADRGVGWSVQHRRARGMGGTRRPDTNEPQSLIVLCGSATTSCHGWVESNREVSTSNGWAVKSNADPLSIPVLHFRDGWVLLTEDGRAVAVDPTEEAA